jgi:hypothetical protein
MRMPTMSPPRKRLLVMRKGPCPMPRLVSTMRKLGAAFRRTEHRLVRRPSWARLGSAPSSDRRAPRRNEASCSEGILHPGNTALNIISGQSRDPPQLHHAYILSTKQFRRSRNESIGGHNARAHGSFNGQPTQQTRAKWSPRETVTPILTSSATVTDMSWTLPPDGRGLKAE